MPAIFATLYTTLNQSRRNRAWSFLSTLSQLLGGAIVLLALAVYVSQKEPGAVIDWAWQVFGPVFLTAYIVLVLLTLQAIHRIRRNQSDLRLRVNAHELGLHTSSGIATLALTFTLLGISLGIGSLSGEELSPDTIQQVISELTGNFATAFMTTVLGLPTTAFMRAMLGMSRSRYIDPFIQEPLTDRSR